MIVSMFWFAFSSNDAKTEAYFKSSFNFTAGDFLTSFNFFLNCDPSSAYSLLLVLTPDGDGKFDFDNDLSIIAY